MKRMVLNVFANIHCVFVCSVCLAVCINSGPGCLRANHILSLNCFYLGELFLFNIQQ